MSRVTKHKRTSHKKWLLVLLGLVVLLVGGYFYRSTYYAERFLPQTKVNGINISGLTVTQANTKLKSTISHEDFVIQDSGKTWKTLTPKEVGWKSDFSDSLTKIQSGQNQYEWGLSLFSQSAEADVDGTTINEETLKTTLTGLQKELTDLNNTKTKAQDATLTKNDQGFEITPEVAGTAFDIEKVMADIENDVKGEKKTIDVSSYTIKPAVTKDDADLKTELTTINKVAQIKAVYSINGNTFQIPTATISDWLTYTDGKVALDQDKVTAYVTDLGTKYNTSTNATTFASTKRGEVSVPAGAYSWSIQTAAETAALTKAILAGEDFTRSPIVSGATTADHALIEKTYIEVDLQNQHMWYYKDGQLQLETDIVSGKPATPTPTGVFYIWDKEENATLRGENGDGTNYETPVSYWMPINWTGVGIHDASWQPQFGGTWYQEHGSHGCVNTPPETVAKLYAMVEEGTPVIVF